MKGVYKSNKSKTRYLIFKKNNTKLVKKYHWEIFQWYNLITTMKI